MKMSYKALCIAALLCCALAGWASPPDKAQADSLLHELLASDFTADRPCTGTPAIATDSHRLDAVFAVKGQYLQVPELRNDVYFIAKRDSAYAVNDPRYPVETLNNLLLGAVAGNQRELIVRHHQYGGRTATLMMPLDEFMCKMMPGHQLYCAITDIDGETVMGVAVFHNSRSNTLHLLQVKAPLATVKTGKGDLEGDLYTNIPQGNIHNLFGKEKSANQPQPTHSQKEQATKEQPKKAPSKKGQPKKAQSKKE